MRNAQLVIRLHVFICILIFSAHTFAAKYDIPKVIAIQHRGYHLSDEIGGFISYLPLDSFTTYFSSGASYAHYFSDYLAWEVANAATANNTSTGLQQFIQNSFTAFPTIYDIINYYVTSNIIYTPMYMKNLVFSSGIGYGDISFVGGGGITNYKAAGNIATIDFGIILRYFLNQHVSLKFDFRNYYFFGANLNDNFAMTLGLAYNFGGSGENPSGGNEE